MTYNAVEDIRLSLYKDKTLSPSDKQERYNTYLKALRKLAYRGDAQAQFALGSYYDEGGYWEEKIIVNKKKAFYWYSKAAEKNNASACNNLASFYLSGTCCDVDANKALQLYDTAIKHGGDRYVKYNYNKLIKEIKKGKYKVNTDRQIV